MISAFGALAERYAAGMGDIDAIVVEPQHVGVGYIEAVRRRKAGESFCTLLLLENARPEFTEVAPLLRSQGGSRAARARPTKSSSSTTVRRPETRARSHCCACSQMSA